MGNLLEYSGITTKIHAMHGKLLTPQDYDEISSMHSTGEVVAYLRDETAYKVFFEDIQENFLHRREVEKLLYRSLYYDYEKLYRFASQKQRRFLNLYLKRYEVNLINYCCRIIFNHYDRPFDLNYIKPFFDRYSQISVEKLITSNTMADLVEGLKDTEYGSTMRRLHESHADNLYDYDLALNLYYFTTLWKSQKKILKGKELDLFKDDCGTKIDLLNLQWIYRGKKYYAMTPAELYAMVIPIHYRIPRELFQEIVDSPTLEEFAASLKRTSYGRKYDFEQKYTLEKTYQMILSHLYLADQRRNPYSIAAVNTYLFLKEEEIKTITTTLECIHYGLSSSETQKYLGGVRK